MTPKEANQTNPVFCNRCTHLLRLGHDTFACGHPDNMRAKNNWLKSTTEQKQHPREINKNCDCAWFKDAGGI